MLRARLAGGEWAPGVQLPSETRLAQEYEVGRGTVRRAIAALRVEGLLDVGSGTGTRVREPVAKERVRVPRGATVDGRMPTEDECRELDLPEGVAVFVVSFGGIEKIYGQDRTTLSHS